MKKDKMKGHFSMFKKGIFGVAMASMMAVTPFFVGCSGAPGKDGAMWYTGLDVSEFETKGNIGDFFYDTDDGVVYQKTALGWSEISVIKGTDGVSPSIQINSDGYWVINGNVTSHQSTGQDGDTPYIKDGTWWIGDNDTSIAVYGEDGKSAFDLYKEQNPEFDGTLADWLESLKGEQGEQGNPGKDGANWLSGIGNPTDSIGKNGDLYLNTLTYDLFIKKSGSWGSPICNIKGQSGANGYDRILATRTGSADNSLVINESGVDLYSLNLADETQETTIYGPNRFNLDTFNFKMSGYESTHTITKENYGLTLDATVDENKTLSSVHAFYYYEAEFDGILWLSCDVELAEIEDGVYGSENDAGIKMTVNDHDASIKKETILKKGTGKSSISIEVKKGDKVKILFYLRMGSYLKNKINYKNIMIQYDELTDFVPFQDYSNYKRETKTININDLTLNNGGTNLTNQVGSDSSKKYYAAYCDLDVSDMAPYILPATQYNPANIKVSGINLLSYNAVYRNNKGLGISSTGRLMLYLGNDFCDGEASVSDYKSYLETNPITITYETNEFEYVGFSDIKIMKGSRIVSSGDFTLEYTFLAEKKS